MSEGKGRSLTRREFDAVIHRAAELAGSDTEASEGALSEAEVYRIAREVGLSERHVRLALAEVRSGGRPNGFLDRIFGPSSVRAARVVPGTPKGLATVLDDFFVGTQLLQPVRRGPAMLQYRPALDWASRVARVASFTQRKYLVASAKSVEVRLEEVDADSMLVEIVVDPGTRGDNIAGAAFGGGSVGLGAGIGAAAVVITAGGAVPLGIGIGLLGGTAALGGITQLVGTSHKKKLLAVQAEVEGILDRLEQGESLEPPPPSWRSWVKRQFHGMARDLMSTEGLGPRDERHGGKKE
jgi:hypothetical protein